MLFWYYTFSFVRKVLLRQCCFVSAVDNKKGGFYKPIFGSHWANRNNISLNSDDKVKTKIRKTSEKIIPVRRKRVEACLASNWDFSSIPTLSSKFINQIVYSTLPYKHLNLSHLSFWQLHSSTCSAQNLDQPPSFLKMKCPQWSPCFFPYLPKVYFLISSQNVLVKAYSKLLFGWLFHSELRPQSIIISTKPYRNCHPQPFP